jgi:hypothetical protein
MSKIVEAREILKALGLPRAQQNERTALTLLALANLTPDKTWDEIQTPLMGITPMMDFMREAYGKHYKPNSRESVRRFSIHQMVDAGITLRNPDDPKRPVNSEYTVYQLEPATVELLKTYGTEEWKQSLATYLESFKTLSERYAKEREMNLIPVKIADGKSINFTPGTHSLLIKAIIEEFAPRFAPGGELIYAGDTGNKYFDDALLASLGVTLDKHGKLPDVAIYFRVKNWLLLVESVTSHGPVDGKRHEDLARLFSQSTAPIVYVTAFPSRHIMAPYLGQIAWETEVWCADAPTHLIHFNGKRFLGPYAMENIAF